MKKLKLYYLVPAILAFFLGGLLILLLLPADLYLKALVVVLFPLLVLGIGFRIITYRRIRIIRSQLYQILETLESFDIDEPKKVAFEESPFPIFNELNEYLIELINRVRANYNANKQFTQNASHELQTPLSIIKGHVEILLQSPNIGEKEINSLAAVLQNTNRLSKLNTALILLSKIENQRFGDVELVKFSEISENLLHNFRDIIELQEIEIIRDYEDEFSIEMSSALAEILIANLIQNAVRYNVKKGFIKILIHGDTFSMVNPGKELEVDTTLLFKRFRRESTLDESLGLGLSIVKRICDNYGLYLSYINEGALHTLSINKPAKING